MRENPYFLNIFNFGQFWLAEIDIKKSRPTGRLVKISNPDYKVTQLQSGAVLTSGCVSKLAKVTLLSTKCDRAKVGISHLSLDI